MRKLNNETIWIFKNQTVKAIMRGYKKIKVIKFTYMYYINLTKKASDYPFLNFHPSPLPGLFLEIKIWIRACNPLSQGYVINIKCLTVISGVRMEHLPTGFLYCSTQKQAPVSGDQWGDHTKDSHSRGVCLVTANEGYLKSEKPN